MADTKSENHVANDSDALVEESNTPEHAAGATVSRMLANPRRVRRD